MKTFLCCNRNMNSNWILSQWVLPVALQYKRPASKQRAFSRKAPVFCFNSLNCLATDQNVCDWQMTHLYLCLRNRFQDKQSVSVSLCLQTCSQKHSDGGEAESQRQLAADSFSWPPLQALRHPEPERRTSGLQGPQERGHRSEFFLIM